MPARNLLLNPDGRFGLPVGGWDATGYTRANAPTAPPEPDILGAFSSTDQGSRADRPNQWIAIDIRERYRLDVWVRSPTAQADGVYFIGLDLADDALQSITHIASTASDPGITVSGNLAALAAPVSPGQTTITLDRDAATAGFPSGASGNSHIALNALDQYADLPNPTVLKYTSLAGAVLTLAAPVPAAMSAATNSKVRWHEDGPSFMYIAASAAPHAALPADIWTLHTAEICGEKLPWVSSFAAGVPWQFRAGTTRIRPITIVGNAASAPRTLEFVFRIVRLSAKLSADYVPGTQRLTLVQQRAIHTPLIGAPSITELHGGRSDRWEWAVESSALVPGEARALAAWATDVGVGGEVLIGDTLYTPRPELSALTARVSTNEGSPQNQPVVPAGSVRVPVTLPEQTLQILRRGEPVQIGEGFHRLTEDVDTGVGTISLSSLARTVLPIEPPTRTAVPAGTRVRVVDPVMRARLLTLPITDTPADLIHHVGMAGEEIA